jgi:hypothetical protein
MDRAGDPVTDRREAAEALGRVLAAAQCERPDRSEWVDSPIGRELGWVLHERRVMLEEVNRLRGERALPPVGVRDVERVEQSAAGHSDYSRKFAWGCAELVERQP